MIGVSLQFHRQSLDLGDFEYHLSPIGDYHFDGIARCGLFEYKTFGLDQSSTMYYLDDQIGRAQDDQTDDIEVTTHAQDRMRDELAIRFGEEIMKSLANRD